MAKTPRICNYQDSSYRTDFWEGQGREYEDLAERIALRRLLPGSGRRLLDVGAGFGRLSQFYTGYDQVVLLDYSESLLRQAKDRLGDDGRDHCRLVYVAADLYAMPFAPDSFDAAMMVRVIHHVEDVAAFLGEMARILAGSGSFVLEFANKCHLKAILRWFARRQDWSPFDQAPYEFVEMNLDFHPAWMRARLAEAMFHVKRTLTVSHFRLPLLKRLIPAQALATMDGLCQTTGQWWQLTPSVFYQCAAEKAAAPVSDRLVFYCPACRQAALDESDTLLACPACGAQWPIEDGIYNLRRPRP